MNGDQTTTAPALTRYRQALSDSAVAFAQTTRAKERQAIAAIGALPDVVRDRFPDANRVVIRPDTDRVEVVNVTDAGGHTITGALQPEAAALFGMLDILATTETWKAIKECDLRSGGAWTINLDTAEERSTILLSALVVPDAFRTGIRTLRGLVPHT